MLKESMKVCGDMLVLSRSDPRSDEAKVETSGCY
jgi:hypothetical protein